MIYVITSTTEDYFNEKLKPWINSAQNISKSAKIFITCVDFIPREPLPEYIDYRTVSSETCTEQFIKGCLQQGDWIQCYPDIKDDDVVIFIDGDIIIQRDFSKFEKTTLNKLNHGDVLVNWNACEGDTLGSEALRIQPIRPILDIKAFWAPEKWPYCFNGGVIASKMSTWKNIFKDYLDNYKLLSSYFSGPARQQWLLSWIYSKPEYKVLIAPQSFHSHGHFNIWPGVYLSPNDIAYYKDDIILFAHKLNWPFDRRLK